MHSATHIVTRQPSLNKTLGSGFQNLYALRHSLLWLICIYNFKAQNIYTLLWMYFTILIKLYILYYTIDQPPESINHISYVGLYLLMVTSLMFWKKGYQDPKPILETMITKPKAVEKKLLWNQNRPDLGQQWYNPWKPAKTQELGNMETHVPFLGNLSNLLMVGTVETYGNLRNLTGKKILCTSGREKWLLSKSVRYPEEIS